MEDILVDREMIKIAEMESTNTDSDASGIEKLVPRIIRDSGGPKEE